MYTFLPSPDLLFTILAWFVSLVESSLAEVLKSSFVLIPEKPYTYSTTAFSGTCRHAAVRQWERIRLPDWRSGLFDFRYPRHLLPRRLVSSLCLAACRRWSTPVGVLRCEGICIIKAQEDREDARLTTS